MRREAIDLAEHLRWRVGEMQKQVYELLKDCDHKYPDGGDATERIGDGVRCKICHAFDARLQSWPG